MLEFRLEHWESSDGSLTEKRMMGLLDSEGFEVASYASCSGSSECLGWRIS